MQAIINGLLTDYDSSGKGKTVLLLHGWGDSRHTYNALIKQFEEHYHVISLDLPGFGKTQSPPNAWDLSDYASFISSFLSKIQVKDLYALIGHSNGCAVAIHALATQKISAKKLVLLAASGVRDTARGKRTAIKLVAKTGKLLTFWLPRHHKRALQKKLYGTVGSDMLAVPQLKETFKRTVRQDVQAEAARLTLPTLLIYGENDRATPVKEIGNRFNELISGSKLHVIPDAEHFVHHDNPQIVARLIKEFLA